MIACYLCDAKLLFFCRIDLCVGSIFSLYIITSGRISGIFEIDRQRYLYSYIENFEVNCRIWWLVMIWLVWSLSDPHRWVELKLVARWICLNFPSLMDPTPRLVKFLIAFVLWSSSWSIDKWVTNSLAFCPTHCSLRNGWVSGMSIW